MTVRALLSLVVVGLLASAAPRLAAADGPQVPAAFAERVAQYVDLHQAVVQLTEADAPGLDPMTALRREWEFARVLRQARQPARRGNIFTPEVAEFFRLQLAEIARGTNLLPPAVRSLEAAGEEDGVEGLVLQINTPFPGRPGAEVPSWLLWRLPALPMELEYRFFGTALVLVDSRAGLIVDILADALPVRGGHTAPPLPRPCDVHPDLKECWT
jgi:hypothetical protein